MKGLKSLQGLRSLECLEFIQVVCMHTLGLALVYFAFLLGDVAVYLVMMGMSSNYQKCTLQAPRTPIALVLCPASMLIIYRVQCQHC